MIFLLQHAIGVKPDTYKIYTKKTIIFNACKLKVYTYISKLVLNISYLIIFKYFGS